MQCSFCFRERGVNMLEKQFKDPIYGYIDISSEKVEQIIDTPIFQRLKDIRQTSYTPLYPAAYHNRFIHSLGVYYLGTIAFSSIKERLKEIIKEEKLSDNLEQIQEFFELACLLHDVGHAPFSHTGETFYLDEAGTLYKKLKETVGDERFTEDFDALGAKPAEHECMSCIVAIRSFDKFFKNKEEKSFFSRCIIGMPFRLMEEKPEFRETMSAEERKEVKKQREKYKINKTEIELLNCIISLLNSSIIDVDRLDYVIRDAATIGFENVQIDYMRLPKGIRILEFEKRLCIGYHKSALSVIESAVYAHDAEKKWVQSHPTILYEMEALKSAMGALTNLFQSETDLNPLFCYEALTEEGKVLQVLKPLFSEKASLLLRENKIWSAEAQKLLEQKELFSDCVIMENYMVSFEYPIHLLADEDFLYLLKQFCKDGLGFEYFARNKRRSAVWKSEAEFRALFQKRIGDDSEDIKILEGDIESLANYAQKKTGQPIINNMIFTILEQEELEAIDAQKNETIDNDYYEDIMRGIATNRHWAKVLLDLAAELKIKEEFLIIFQKKFNSSFKATLEDIPIYFPNVEDSVVPLGKVVTTIGPQKERKSNFFHLFYDTEGEFNSEKKTIVNRIAKGLVEGINKK